MNKPIDAPLLQAAQNEGVVGSGRAHESAHLHVAGRATRITSADFGPCTCNGDTSGSPNCTSSPEFSATPLAHSSTSASAKDSQK
jgi:hypothetical protein